MPKKLLFPEDIQLLLARRFSNQHQRWLAGEASEEGWPQRFSLGAPTQAEATADFTATQKWTAAWRQWDRAGTVEWETRQWPKLGEQKIPVRLAFSGPAEFASAINEDHRWSQASRRFASMVQRWPALAASLATYFAALADYPEADYARLVALLTWLQANPNSGIYLRQIPVEGLDTKWVEQRKSLVLAIAQPLLGSVVGSDFEDTLGLRRAPIRVRMRILCPLIRGFLGNLGDIQAPIEDLVPLAFNPERIIVVENLQTGLALPDISGAVAFIGLGHSVGLLERIHWLRGVPAIYWGDLDTHGFAILDRARKALPQLKSVLMDEQTLLSHRIFWVKEPTQYSGRDLMALTPKERGVYEGLLTDRWDVRVRMEQERISWPDALRLLLLELR